jgi:hypothetical protein
MLHVPQYQYRRRWEEKLAWYRANKIVPSGEGGGERGVLIRTQDGANGSIDAANILSPGAPATARAWQAAM